MKKHIYILCSLAICVLFFTSCDLDNYDEPNAGMKGRFVDAETGEIVPMSVQGSDGLKIFIYEKDRFYAPEGDNNFSREPLIFYATYEGSYEKTWMFAADYLMTFENANFLPVDTLTIPVKAGQVTQKDIVVTPYARIQIVNTEIDQLIEEELVTETNDEGESVEVMKKVVKKRDLNVTYKISRSSLIADEDKISTTLLYWNVRPAIDNGGAYRLGFNSVNRSSQDTADLLDVELTQTIDLAADKEFNTLNRQSVIMNNDNQIYVRIGVNTAGNYNYSVVVPVKVNFEEYK